MLASSVEEIKAAIRPSDVVLDIGGWANPFPRADWVIDLFPHVTRGLYGRNGWPAHGGVGEAERFTEATWITRDVCDREPFPFDDNAIDFVVCGHTLEDIRDPVWVCAEMSRIARAGYVEVPSRREEQAIGVEGPYAGRGHHRWLIDRDAEVLRFVAKPWHRLPAPGHHFPAGYHAGLEPAAVVECIWWTGELDATELVHVDTRSVDEYLGEYVSREHRGATTPRWRPRLKRRRSPA